MNMPTEQLVAVGLDVGTGGARAIAADPAGRIVARARADFPAGVTRVAGPRIEQDPRAWTAAAEKCLCELTARLDSQYEVAGVAVCATSGTFLLAGEDARPLTPGIMYNDLRASGQAVTDAAAAVRDDLDAYGIRIAPAFALSKIVHLARMQPDLFSRCRRIVHQTDWIVGMLCGRYDVTDVSTALKTGADPGKLAWPAAIHGRLGVPEGLLPQIVLSGTPIGRVTAAAAGATGLPAGTPVVAGCTDGTAGCLASGAKRAGDLNVTLGSTLVFKTVADRPLVDPAGSLYNHRHPAGGYLPGAASNTGGDWIPRHFPHADLDAVGRAAFELLPTGKTVYPLVRTGERFPFASTSAVGFGLDDIASPELRFAAGMEGVAFLERMGIERFESLGLKIGPTVYATGGGAGGAAWLLIRASVNRRRYEVPAEPDCATGAAVLAAVPHFGDCGSAVAAMVRPGRTVEPKRALADAYDEGFERFKSRLAERGYLD